MRGAAWIVGGIAALAVLVGARRYAWPVVGRITSRFGEPRASGPHNGVDIAAPVGTPVKAPAAGVVLENFAHPEGGLSMRVRLEDDTIAGFAHLSGYIFRPGERFAKGAALAYTGATGHVTGPHLHYTLKRGGEYLDPEKHSA